MQDSLHEEDQNGECIGSQYRQKNKGKILMNKAGLTRNARISPFAVDRIEKGTNCRIEAKRKIIPALRYDLSEKNLNFKND